MKTNKLLAAGALALSMAMTPVASLFNAMPIAAEATTTTHTLTINNFAVGDEYTIYQIFTGKNNTANNGKTLTDVKWGNGLTDAGKKKIGGVQADGEVPSAETAASYLEGLTAAQVRELASGLTASDLTNGTEKTAASITLQFDNLVSGYYLVVYTGANSKPSESILKVVNTTTVNAKTTTVPDYEKKVTENVKDVKEEPGVVPSVSGDRINDVADYNIGDEVPFTLAAVVPANLENYDNYKFTFQDTMDQGLTLVPGSVKVSVVTENETTVIEGKDGESVKNADYVTIGEVDTAKNSFDVVVEVIKTTENGRKQNVKSGTKIIVEFKATLNSNAQIATPDNELGNENKFTLKYTNNPVTGGEGTTTTDEVVVFTYTLDVDKTTDNGQTPLTGAKFILSRGTGDNKQYLKVTGSAGVYTVNEWTTDESQATELEGNASANYKISGLDAGTYYLKETVVPDGYNTPAGEFEVILSATTENNQLYEGTPSDAVSAISTTLKDKDNNDIVNTKGPQLPETGGMGTTMIYGVGAVMVAGAAVFYVTNKRTRKD